MTNRIPESNSGLSNTTNPVYSLSSLSPSRLTRHRASHLSPTSRHQRTNHLPSRTSLTLMQRTHPRHRPCIHSFMKRRAVALVGEYTVFGCALEVLGVHHLVPLPSGACALSSLRRRRHFRAASSFSSSRRCLETASVRSRDHWGQESMREYR